MKTAMLEKKNLFLHQQPALCLINDGLFDISVSGYLNI